MNRAGNVQIEDLFEAQGVRRGFSTAVMSEVAAFQRASGIDDPTLVDLTALPFVTIDHDDSRDLDQALYIARRGAGYAVYYALADGAYYVRPGSALFTEALARGASFYLPEICEPMLPRALSEDLVSLNPEVDRRALVFEMTLDVAGKCTGTTLCRARVHSRAKLSYNGVQALLDGPGEGPLAGRDFTASLGLLRTVGLLRMEEARQRSVIRFDRAEIWLSRDASGFRVVGGRRNDVERYNEQISLLCNIEGAAFLGTDGPTQPYVQPIYRVHPAPERDRLREVAERIDGLVDLHGLSPDGWRWQADDEGEPLGDYLRRLPRGGDEGRITLAIARQVRYTFQRSDFRPEPGPHFGVGAPAYCRFSSPMREIAGIFTHKEAIEKLESQGGDDAADLALRELVIAAANAAKSTQSALQKAVHKLALDALFEPELASAEAARTQFLGTVMGLRGSRLYVELDEPPVEVKIYVRDLAEGKERFRSQRSDAVLTSGDRSFRLGDCVRVWVRGYDPKRRRWQLQADRVE